MANSTGVLAKVRRRLIPFLFLLYVVSYLDRINVGFAALQMNAALGLSATAYGLGAGIFFLSYTVFEVPSNVILARLGARLWIARIMITWGLVSAGMMLARRPMHFYALRFLLGAAEAGFFPGIIFYLTQWFPSRERARTIAAFMTATLVAGIVGGPVSGLLLSMHGIGGLAGWQWLFLLEGLPAVVLGFVVLSYLTDRPKEATWLSEAERSTLVAMLHQDRQGRPTGTDTVAGALKSGRVWLLAVVYFTIPLALYTFGFWLPQIIKAASNRSDLAVGLLSAIPYVVGCVGMVVAAQHSDRTGERRWHVIIGALVGGAAFAVSAGIDTLAGSLVALSVAMLGLASMFGPFWAFATSSLAGTGAAAAIALINSVGNTAGFIGPYLLGYIRDVTHSFSSGLVVIGAILAAAPLLVLTVDDHERRVRGGQMRAMVLAFAVACLAVPARVTTQSTGDPVTARARQVHENAIVIDTHADTTQRLLTDKTFDLAARHQDGGIDIPRMREGGLDALFFSIWIPADITGRLAARRAMEQIDLVREAVRTHPNDLLLATSAADIRRAAAARKIAVLMGMEGGHMIADDLGLLRSYAALGVRYLTLTHGRNTKWADSSTDKPRHNGLTPFGKDVVRELNRLGVMVDVSHVSDKTFYDALEVTRAPVIASHSSSRAISDSNRNLTDDMLRALARNGGVVMINYAIAFLSEEFRVANRALPRPVAAARAAASKKCGRNDACAILETNRINRDAMETGELPKVSWEKIVEHIDHAVQVAGIDHVGLGSDFDGASMPIGMEDASKLPKLTDALLKKSYSERDVEKILGANLLRVMEQVERIKGS